MYWIYEEDHMKSITPITHPTLKKKMYHKKPNKQRMSTFYMMGKHQKQQTDIHNSSCEEIGVKHQQQVR